MHWLWLALGVNYLAALVVVGRILRRRREPPAMVAWIFAVLVVPVGGMLVYWLLGSGRLLRKAGRRRRRVAHLVARFRERGGRHAPQVAALTEDQLPEDLAKIEKLGARLADMPATGGNDVQILQEANTTYAALEAALQAARHHIHLEYYIWQPDETGYHFRNLVIERARAGVACRLLFDAVGCWRLGREFLQPLTDAGVRYAFFLPLYLLPLGKRWSVHLRNHRKIAIVDGQLAFMGSQNIGDEYRGRRARLSPWYDTHMQLSGPAALFLQEVFAEDWYLATRERLDPLRDFAPPQRAGRSPVQILATGPDQRHSTLIQIIFAAVSSARSSIRISTPYFVPGLPLQTALAHACYRGVHVRLVLPTRSDSMLSLWAARSYYAELIDAGVEIHEYDGGVLHSKLMTVDDRWCMLGSANMDARSFRLNYEVTALIYDAAVSAELGRSIDGFCERGRRIAPRDVHRQPVLRQLGEGAARLFSPLL